MQLSTILTMVSVLGIVWGGVIFFIYKATVYEKLKRNNGKA